MALGFGGAVVARARAVLEADTRDLDRGLDRSEKKWKSYNKVAVGAALGVVAAAAVGAKKTIDAASAVNEQIDKNRDIFKSHGGEIVAWSKTMAKSAGISSRAALEATGVLGNMLTPMGIVPGKAAAMSKTMVALAGDMASFNDASPEEVLQAMQSGLAGETEPLRRFGVFLSAAKVESEALRLGLVEKIKVDGDVADASTRVEIATRRVQEATQKHGKTSIAAKQATLALHSAENGLEKAMQGKKSTLTDAQKAQATYSILLRESSAAQGNYAKTAGSAANQERRIAAERENQAASIGRGLLPAYQALQRALLKIIQFTSEHERATKILATVVLSLAAAILVANGAYKAYTAGVTAARNAQALFNAVMAANPYVRIAILILAIGAALVVAYKKSETFRDIVNGVFDSVKRVVGTVISGLLLYVDKWLAGIEAIARVGAKLPFVGDKFKGVAEKIADGRDRIRELRDGIDGLHGKTVAVKVNLRYTGAAGARPGDGVISFGSLNGAISHGAATFAPPLSPPATNPGGLKPFILDELGLARSYGLSLTSGLRPGATTSTGRPSLHGVGQAIDVAGAPGSMAMFAQAVAGRPGIAEVIYTPVGAWYPGVGWTRPRGKIASDHYDHVHVGARGDGLVGTVGEGLATATLKVAGALRLPFTGDGRQTAWQRALTLRSKALMKTPAGRAAKSKAVAAERKAIEARAQRASDTADRTSANAGRAGDRGRREWELRASQATTAEGVAVGQRLAVQAQIGAAKKDLSAKKSKYSALKAAAAAARRKGFHGLAATLERQAADVRQDILDQQLSIRELTAQRNAIKPDTGSVDAGGDAGGDTGVGGFDGGDSGGGGFDSGFSDPGFASPAGPSAEEIEAQVRERVAQESAAVLSARSRFISDFAPNIFRLGAGGTLAPGSGPPQQTIFQTTFTKPPEDPFVWLSRVQFAARR